MRRGGLRRPLWALALAAVIALACAGAPGSATGAQVRVIVVAAHPDRLPGLRIDRQLPLLGGVSGTVAADDLSRLRRAPGVRLVSLDRPMVSTATAKPGSNLVTLYPSLDAAPEAWSKGYTGAGVGIAVVDSGAVPHADFGSRLVQVRLGGQSAMIDDTYGHGTLVAGIAGGSSADGRYMGIATGAKLYAVNVARADGTVYSSDVIAGLSWVYENRASTNIRVVNLSLQESAPTSYLQNPLDTAVERLWKAGIVVVVAAGNRGPGGTSYAPANDPFAITVGALDPKGTAATGDDSVASWSSTGKTLDNYDKPDLVAPGRAVVSFMPTTGTLYQQAPASAIAEPGYVSLSGTSTAAPQVAGAAAILLQQHPTWTPDQVKCALANSARSVSGSSARTLDLQAAVAYKNSCTANQGLVQATFGLVDGVGGTSSAGWTLSAGWTFSAGWTLSAAWTSFFEKR
jgi:serine protease AprX